MKKRVGVKKKEKRGEKYSGLIDYRSIVIDYDMLSIAWRVESCIDLIDYNCFIVDYTVVWDNKWFIQESLL